MSQLLVTSAPVIYIFLLLERKQQKWSLLKRADTVNGNTSCWVHCKLKHFVWGTGAPSHLQIPPWGYANEIESYDTAYGGNLGGLFWYVCLDKNLKGRSCVCFLPKLPWVHNKLPLTEAAPRKKASCYLEPKSSWFIRPGYFPETVFPSPWCPGERLQRAARPKDCSTGMLCALWTAHLSGSGRTWRDNCWGCLIQDRGLIPHWASDQIKSSMLAFSPLSPQNHFWPFSSWSVPKDADLWWWGFLAPWPTESCTGEAWSQRWIGGGVRDLFPMPFLPQCGVSPWDWVPPEWTQSPCAAQLPAPTAHWLQWLWSPSSFSSTVLVASHCCPLLGASPSLSSPLILLSSPTTTSWKILY